MDIGLWKLNLTTGYWVLVRMCSTETAQQWLVIFQRDEPNDKFKLSKRKPKN